MRNSSRPSDLALYADVFPWLSGLRFADCSLVSGRRAILPARSGGRACRPIADVMTSDRPGSGQMRPRASLLRLSISPAAMNCEKSWLYAVWISFVCPSALGDCVCSSDRREHAVSPYRLCIGCWECLSYGVASRYELSDVSGSGSRTGFPVEWSMWVGRLPTTTVVSHPGSRPRASEDGILRG